MYRNLKNSWKSITLISVLFIFLIPSYSISGDITERKASPGTPITSPRCNVFTFDASGSYDPDNEKLSFFWDFGDGHKSTEPIVEHTYKKPGNYNVTLTISDNSGLGCSKAVTTQVVRADLAPVADFEIQSKEICSEDNISFDASKSSVPRSNKIFYEWDFGDGTKASGKRRVSKSYKKGGPYKVTLTVSDGNNTSCSAQKTEKTIQVHEPPIADAGEKEILKCVNNESDLIVSFDASKSAGKNNKNLSYNWDFGDGKKAEGIKVNHRYSETGNYQAKLIVTDNSNLGCGTNVDLVTVRLNKMTKADAGEDIIACKDEAVTFDGTNSFVNKKGTATAKWFFGDGDTATGFTATHAYAKSGQYQASLSVKNELNNMCPPSRDTRLVSINAAPTVSLKSVNSICLGDDINLDASSASDPDNDNLEYYWSFGDGVILKDGPKTTHIFKQGGNYRVTVIVDDGKETACSTATADKYVKVNTPPVADAGADLACCVGMVSNFDASGSNDPDNDNLSYVWDFGDGTTFKGEKATHIYTKSGSFNVSLTVDDNSGSSCSKSTSGFTAKVNAKPVPIINIR